MIPFTWNQPWTLAALVVCGVVFVIALYIACKPR